MDLADINYATSHLDGFLWPDQEEKLRRKRERILNAATELFVRLGYRKTSVDEVARKAGVAKGTVYLYYRTKAELVYHALANEKREHIERMRPLAEVSSTPQERLWSFVKLGVLMSREMPLTASLITGDHEISLAVLEMDEKVLADVNEKQAKFMRLVLNAATNHSMSRADLKKRSQALVDVLFALVTSDRINAQGLAWEDYANTVADLIVDGAVAKPASSLSKAGLQSSSDTGRKAKRPQRVGT